MQKRPNLFVIGAMKSGTTSVHRALGSHPDIYMSHIKEPAFFADPDQLAEDSKLVASRGIAANETKYLSLFRHAGSARYRGESSTHYSKLPRLTGVADKMAAFSPDARIIYVVRDPIERAISHYKHAVRMKAEWKSFSQAIRLNHIYLSVSDYARQIAPYLDKFGHTQVRLFTFEEMAMNPPEVLQTTFRWLQLEELPQANVDLPHANRTPDASRRSRGRGLHLTLRFISLFGDDGKELDIFRRVATREITAADTRNRDVLSHLKASLQPSVQRLSEMFDREFPEWTTVNDHWL